MKLNEAFLGRPVLVRAAFSDAKAKRHLVFFGTVATQDGLSVTLRDARVLYDWRCAKGIGVSSLALYGSMPENAVISPKISELQLQAATIYLCTPLAANFFSEFPTNKHDIPSLTSGVRSCVDMGEASPIATEYTSLFVLLKTAESRDAGIWSGYIESTESGVVLLRDARYLYDVAVKQEWDEVTNCRGLPSNREAVRTYSLENLARYGVCAGGFITAPVGIVCTTVSEVAVAPPALVDVLKQYPEAQQQP